MKARPNHVRQKGLKRGRSAYNEGPLLKQKKPSVVGTHARILEPMTLGPIQLRDKVLRNIAAQGQVGASWLEALPSLLRRLEVEWGIQVGRPFPNAPEAFVAEAMTADGRQVALKIPIVGLAKADRELSLLQTASGRGYVRLLRHDRISGARLLERSRRRPPFWFPVMNGYSLNPLAALFGGVSQGIRPHVL